MSEPTKEQLRLCIAEWLMYGEAFPERERKRVAALYADGYDRFSSPECGVIEHACKKGSWSVTDKGKALLAGQDKGE